MARRHRLARRTRRAPWRRLNRGSRRLLDDGAACAMLRGRASIWCIGVWPLRWLRGNRGLRLRGLLGHAGEPVVHRSGVRTVGADLRARGSGVASIGRYRRPVGTDARPSSVRVRRGGSFASLDATLRGRAGVGSVAADFRASGHMGVVLVNGLFSESAVLACRRAGRRAGAGGSLRCSGSLRSLSGGGLSAGAAFDSPSAGGLGDALFLAVAGCRAAGTPGCDKPAGALGLSGERRPRTCSHGVPADAWLGFVSSFGVFLNLVPRGADFLASELSIGRLRFVAGHFGAVDWNGFTLITCSRILSGVSGIGDISQGNASDFGCVTACQAVAANAFVDDRVVVTDDVVINHR